MNPLIKSAIALGTVYGARRATELLDWDDVLGRVGLSRKPTALDRALPIFGLVAFGAAVGAGAALCFAPSSGSELREKISGRLDQAKDHIDDMKHRMEAKLENVWERDRTGAENERPHTHS